MASLEFFELAKELNETHHEELLKKELHFRGNFNSISLVSLSQKSPEMGKSSIKSKATAEKYLKNLKLQIPGRLTREKHLQAYIIQKSLLNGGEMPFGGYKFLTSEIAFSVGDRKRLVNDILAIDSDGTLVIIELKSLRDTKVIDQTISFNDNVVQKESKLFSDLVTLLSGKQWNNKVKRVAVWPKKGEKAKNKKYNIDELYGYDIPNVKEKGNLLVFDSIVFEKE